jgi:hypothetical protein
MQGCVAGGRCFFEVGFRLRPKAVGPLPDTLLNRIAQGLAIGIGRRELAAVARLPLLEVF